jgi:hypothetical protein
MMKIKAAMSYAETEYLLWLFVSTVFVNCICSVGLLLKVFILSVVLCFILYVVLL